MQLVTRPTGCLEAKLAEYFFHVVSSRSKLKSTPGIGRFLWLRRSLMARPEKMHRYLFFGQDCLRVSVGEACECG